MLTPSCSLTLTHAYSLTLSLTHSPSLTPTPHAYSCLHMQSQHGTPASARALSQSHTRTHAQGFNQLWKIDRELFRIWLEVLNATTIRQGSTEDSAIGRGTTRSKDVHKWGVWSKRRVDLGWGLYRLRQGVGDPADSDKEEPWGP